MLASLLLPALVCSAASVPAVIQTLDPAGVPDRELEVHATISIEEGLVSEAGHRGRAVVCVDEGRGTYVATVDERGLETCKALDSRGRELWSSARNAGRGTRLIDLAPLGDRLVLGSTTERGIELRVLRRESGEVVAQAELRTAEALAIATTGELVAMLGAEELVALDAELRVRWRRPRGAAEALAGAGSAFVMQDPEEQALVRLDARQGAVTARSPFPSDDRRLAGVDGAGALVFDCGDTWIALDVDWERGGVRPAWSVPRRSGGVLVPEAAIGAIELADGRMTRIPALEALPFDAQAAFARAAPSAGSGLRIHDDGTLVVASRDAVELYVMDAVGRRTGLYRPRRLHLEPHDYWTVLAPDGAALFGDDTRAEIVEPSGASTPVPRESARGALRISGRLGEREGIWVVTAAEAAFFPDLRRDAVLRMEIPRSHERAQLTSCSANRRGQLACVLATRPSGSLGPQEHHLVLADGSTGRIARVALPAGLQYAPRVALGADELVLSVKARWSALPVLLVLRSDLTCRERLALDLDPQSVWTPFLVRGGRELWLYDGRFRIVKCRL